MANQNLNITIKALDKTKGAFASAARGIKAVGSAIFSMKTALAGVVGAVGLGLLIRQSIQTTDALAKTASKIGTTTEELSKLRYAADLTGVSATTMDMALQRFTRRTAEAAKGTGEAKAALKELGLDAKALVNMPLSERMLALSDAFSEARPEAEKLALAFKLFDSEGAALVNTLALGKDGLNAMFADAQTLGIVMSSTAAKGVEKANDALTKLFSLFRGIRDQIVAALAPIIERLSNNILERLRTAIEDTSGSVEKFAQETIVNFVKSFGRFLVSLSEGVRALEAFGNGIGHIYQQFTDQPLENIFSTELSDKIADMGFKLNEFANDLDFTSTAGKDLNNTTGTTSTLFSQFGDAIATVANQMPSIQDGMMGVAKQLSDGVTNGFTDAITGAKSFSDAMKDMAKSVINSLIKMMIQYHITKPLMEAVGGAFGIPSTATGKAIGGSVQAGQPYMVGERGQELFVPNQSGSIIPNNELGGGSGVVVNQTINVSTGVQQTVRAEISNLMPQIQEATKSAVADARARGGSYSKALLGA